MKDIRLVIEEIEKHKEKLLYTKNKILSWVKLNISFFEDMDKVETIDSFIFRFAKMQSSMGERFFPLVLEYLGEDVKGKPFIDILNRLEVLNLIPSAGLWKEIRELRNRLVHIYPWEKIFLLEEITLALKYSQILIDIFENIKKYLKNRQII